MHAISSRCATARSRRWGVTPLISGQTHCGYAMSPSLSSGATCPVRPGQAAAQPQGDVHQGEEHRHLDQGSDHAGQCLSGGDPEDPDRHGDGELEVVAGGGEGQGRRSRVGQGECAPDGEAQEPHDEEVAEQRKGDPGSTGVCGTSVDAALASFAGDLEWLAGNGIPVRRHNLGQEPGVFAERDRVRTMLQEDGQDCLPIVIVEGSVRSTGRYPSRSELGAWTGLDPATTKPAALSVSTEVITELAVLGAAVGSNCESCSSTTTTTHAPSA